MRNYKRRIARRVGIVLPYPGRANHPSVIQNRAKRRVRQQVGPGGQGGADLLDRAGARDARRPGAACRLTGGLALVIGYAPAEHAVTQLGRLQLHNQGAGVHLDVAVANAVPFAAVVPPGVVVIVGVDPQVAHGQVLRRRGVLVIGLGLGTAHGPTGCYIRPGLQGHGAGVRGVVPQITRGQVVGRTGIGGLDEHPVAGGDGRLGVRQALG